MKIGKVHNWKKVLTQLLLLAFPTFLLAAYVLWDVNSYYAILQNNWLKQSLYFGAGMAASLVFYSYRFRFITTAALLFLVYYIGYRLVGQVSVGEFDAFFASVHYLIFVILFSLGWICGYGFSRSRYFTLFWSLYLLAVQIVTISKTTEITANALIGSLLPVIAYAAYIIYTAELIRNMNDTQQNFGWSITKRITGFFVIMTLILLTVFSIFDKDFKAIEKQWADNGGKYNKKQRNGESMTKENKDGTISNKNQTQLSGALNKGKRLVFVAKLDNYFEDGVTPNPLYFTAFHYTKFDTLTQTFETDSLMPANDLFKPNPSKIPIYFAQTDSSVIRNTNAPLRRKVVNAEIYKTLLAPDEYVAPSTAFFCQPLPVESAYREQYKSAYRAKMWVSDLNSAYFIYNPAGNSMLETFQETRFNLLREVKDFSSIDPNFLQYYTYMPSNAEYNRIRALAGEITKDAVTPVDKIIAIRDYFLSKDQFGQPLYKYTDNPGVPGIPSANKLNYFLFENRQGYCAYYAGATLFLLRALGIPSRVTAGFLTVDRSSKNPGWYWFYEDQAHAWVQVYFPGYGWIDFDTTIPDQNTHDAPQPDGTPPLNMQQAYLVADGNIVTLDTIRKKATMTVEKLLFHDQNYETKSPATIDIDAAIANVSTDTGAIRFAQLQKGMHITAASFAEALKDDKPLPTENMTDVLKRLPKPTPVDEIKVIEPEKPISDASKQKLGDETSINWLRVLYLVLVVIICLFILVCSLPWLIWQFLHQRAKLTKSVTSKAFYQYRAALYYLHQLGHARTHLGPGEHARRIDQQFQTRFSDYSAIYQKLKYSTLPLTAKEQAEVAQFYVPFIKTVRKQVPLKTRVARFLDIYQTIHFFTQPK